MKLWELFLLIGLALVAGWALWSSVDNSASNCHELTVSGVNEATLLGTSGQYIHVCWFRKEAFTTSTHIRCKRMLPCKE